jgi:tRNA threonylcarbamoyl adenosine modification protein (Sua5/YciO/YrdC/YwlC family)
VRRIPIEALDSPGAELSAFRALLSRGGVAAIPTETFYGLAADPRDERAVRRIVAAKGRDDARALPVVFSRPGDLADLGITAAEELLAPYLRIWPAPLTVVLPIREPVAASRGARKLAIRIPASTRLRRLLDHTGPLTATSANRSGDPPLDDPDAVERIFGGSLDCLVDGGRTPGGQASTVLDATEDPPRVLRAGAFPWPGK